MALPARDEAGTVGGAVAALAAQRGPDGRPFDPERYEVIVLANNCRDGTADAARAAAAEARRLAPGFRLHVAEVRLPPARAHSGGARRLAMQAAWRRLRALGPLGDPPGGPLGDPLGDAPGGRPRVVATTDADTVVAPDWLAATLAEVAAGADAVGGRVVADRLDALPRSARALYLYDAGYRHLVAMMEARLDPDPHDPWPRHHQHFGASLAVTVDAYARAGGVPAVRALEDVGLYEALVRAGRRVRHSPRVRATTSVRRCGRAHVGLATQIGEWVEARDGRWLVESAAFVERWVRAGAALRAVWRGEPPSPALAVAVGLAPPVLARAAAERRPFGAFLLDEDLRGRFARAWDAGRHGPLHEDVRAAVRALRVRVAELRHGGGRNSS